LFGFGVILAAALAARLAFEIHRLLFEPEGPIDFLIMKNLIRDWFAQTRVYVRFRGTVHPPITFLLLWPLFGWASGEVARWFFVLTAAAVTAALAAILVRESGATSRADRILLATIVVACYPTAITIGNGQITLHVVLVTIAAVLVALRKPPGIGRDVALGALFLWALVKPNMTLPFFWVIAFTRGWTRPVAFALVSYLGLSAVSVALHGTGLEGVRALVAAWYAKGEIGFAHTGYGNIHEWMGDAGLEDWIFPASGVVFALHGLWAWRHRRADPWVAIGVAAIVARLWAYHREYDDLLLVLPLIALYRLARGPEPVPHARALFALGSLALLAPITPLREYASWALVILWLCQLAVLAAAARRPAEPRPVEA
jgi:hypothetical protein